ncbi:ATP-dependent RNA helicase DBP2 [Diachasma alloeum]|uniref:ATP-dependent RNA helicase DBP2 n=1 Tax=Diachasma alloeum TaxID=454923 RepID=UPI00073847B6|nr:ATP-dependent RNA helicase DBP2 [Diachasma alloeum]XP_015120550.1 ATP-dependent RNA helicase DBP2 [Diachasma alloeum]
MANELNELMGLMERFLGIIPGLDLPATPDAPHPQGKNGEGAERQANAEIGPLMGTLVRFLQQQQLQRELLFMLGVCRPQTPRDFLGLLGSFLQNHQHGERQRGNNGGRSRRTWGGRRGGSGGRGGGGRGGGAYRGEYRGGYWGGDIADDSTAITIIIK